jgi:hypothetical protein
MEQITPSQSQRQRCANVLPIRAERAQRRRQKKGGRLVLKRGTPESEHEAGPKPCVERESGRMNRSGTDFTLMRPVEIAAFLAAHQDELGMSGVTADQVTASIEAGRTILEVRPYGFALVQLMDGLPHLWALYVKDAQRQQGHGKVFMRELLYAHSSRSHMTLICEGPRRRKFFSRFGFRVEGRLGQYRKMTTNPGRTI